MDAVTFEEVGTSQNEDGLRRDMEVDMNDDGWNKCLS